MGRFIWVKKGLSFFHDNLSAGLWGYVPAAL